MADQTTIDLRQAINERLDQMQQAAPTTATTNVQMDTADDLRRAITQLQQQNLGQAYVENVKPSLAPQTERARGLAEQVLQPFEELGSAVGSFISSAKPDLNDPRTRAILGEEPGRPLDITTGADFMTRLGSQFTFNRAEQAYAIKAANPNVQDVRFNAIGEPVMTVLDKATGQTKDILFNPVGWDAGDFTFLLANAPAMLAGGWAAIGKNPETLQGASALARWFLSSRSGKIAAASRMGIAGQAVGLGEQLGARGVMAGLGELPEGPLPMEAVAEHAVGALADTLFGTALGVAGGTTSRVITPISRRGPIQMDAEAAANLWRRVGQMWRTDTDYQFTPGMKTGSPFLLRSEAFAGQKPGSAGVLGEMAERNRSVLNEMQRISIGTEPSAVPPADLVGKEALSTIGTRLTPLDSVVDRATQDVLTFANQEIKNEIAAATKIPQPVAQTSVGQALFNGAQARHEAFEKASSDLYRVVTQDPLVLGQGRNISSTPLSNDAREILKSLPSFEKDVSIEIPTVDAYGSPISGSVTGTMTTPITAALKPNTVSILKQLSSAGGGRIGYTDLIATRNDIGDAISKGNVLGDIGTSQLKRLYGTLTTAIKDGLDSLDESGGLREAWEIANAHRAENIKKFTDLDILPIYKSAEQRGALDLYDIVDRATRSQGTWKAYSDFFGSGSHEMNQLRRAFADKLVGRTVGSDTVNLQAFSQRLASAFENQSDIMDDIFTGKNLTRLKALGEAGQEALKGNVDAKELAEAMNQGPLTKQVLKDLATVQELREQTYRNGLLKQMRAGNFDLNPSQFVDNVVFARGVEPRDVREVMSLLNDKPALQDEIAQRVKLRIFNESLGGPETKERVRSGALRAFLENGSDGDMIADRIEAVIGGDQMKLIKAIHDIVRPSDIVEGTYRAAGGISGGMAISNLEKSLLDPKSMVGSLGGILKSFLIASAYKTGPTRAYISNNVFGETGTIADRAAFVNAWISATPLLEDMLKFFGQDSETAQNARIATIQLKNAVDTDLRKAAQTK